MKVALIKKLTYFVDNPSIDSYHYTMFHGIAARGGNKSAVQHLFINQHPRIPLLWMFNAHKIHHLLQPGVNFIASDLLRKKLLSVPKIDFLAVKIQKIVDIAYREYDFNRSDANRNDAEDEGEEAILIGDGIDELRNDALSYYELLCPRYMDASNAFKDRVLISRSIGTTEWDPKIELSISIELMTAYPLLWVEGCFIASKAVYDVLRPSLIYPYYLVDEFKIDH